jgi:hypothetical protein
MTHAVAALRSARARVRAAWENLRTFVGRVRSEAASAESRRRRVLEPQTAGGDQQVRAGGTTIANRAASVWGTPVPSTSSTG